MVESNILEDYFVRFRAAAEQNIKEFQQNLKPNERKAYLHPENENVYK